MTHEEAANVVAPFPLDVKINDAVITILKDADGFEVLTFNVTTNKKRTIRYDAVKSSPGQYVRYDVGKKPTTRTHEVVEVGTNPYNWVYDNFDYFINLVKDKG